MNVNENDHVNLHNSNPQTHTLNKNPTKQQHVSFASPPRRGGVVQHQMNFASPPRRGALAPRRHSMPAASSNNNKASDIFISDDVIITKGQYANKRGVVKTLTEKTCRIVVGDLTTGNIPLSSVKRFVDNELFSECTPQKKLRSNSSQVVSVTKSKSPTPRKRRREEVRENTAKNVTEKETEAGSETETVINNEMKNMAAELEKLNTKLNEIKINTPAKGVTLSAAAAAAPAATPAAAPAAAVEDYRHDEDATKKQKTKISSPPRRSTDGDIADMEATEKIVQEVREEINDKIPKVTASVWLNGENKMNPKIKSRLDGWRAKYMRVDTSASETATTTTTSAVTEDTNDEKSNVSGSAVKSNANAAPHIDKSCSAASFPKADDIFDATFSVNDPKEISGITPIN